MLLIVNHNIVYIVDASLFQYVEIGLFLCFKIIQCRSFQLSTDSFNVITTGLFDMPHFKIFVYYHDVLYFHGYFVKITILLSFSDEAPVPFLQNLPSISHETTVSSLQMFYGVFQFWIHWSCKISCSSMYGQLFSKKRKEGSEFILYRVSQNRFSVRHPINQSCF